tara:strand:+ start:11199 stop:11402 length:204 start_codon:yes stop_codon:yes gene_type:complete
LLDNKGHGPPPAHKSETIGEEAMQGSDYDTQLVEVHEHGWHNWTKFVLWSIIAIVAILALMAAFLID